MIYGIYVTVTRGPVAFTIRHNAMYITRTLRGRWRNLLPYLALIAYNRANGILQPAVISVVRRPLFDYMYLFVFAETATWTNTNFAKGFLPTLSLDFFVFHSFEISDFELL